MKAIIEEADSVTYRCSCAAGVVSDVEKPLCHGEVTLDRTYRGATLAFTKSELGSAIILSKKQLKHLRKKLNQWNKEFEDGQEI